MATATTLGRQWPALSEHKQLRFFTIFLLYVAQGLPIGFFQFAIPAWLAASGASAASVGLVVSAASLPWSLKLINGFVMDRWAYLPMGRRRAWLIGAQVGIVATMMSLALVGAVPEEAGLLAAFAFTANLFTTFQDVAIDGMAIDLIPDAERGRANGFMFGGQALGIAVGTAGAGLALAASGMTAAALLTGTIVAALLLLTLLLRERPGERLMPWSEGSPSDHALALHAGAWKPVLLGVFRAMRPLPTLLYLAGAFFASSALGIFYGLAPLLGVRELGWSNDAISNLSSIGNLVGAAVAVLAVGLLADRLGARRMVIAFCSASAALALFMLVERDLWSLPIFFIVFVVGYLLVDTAIRTCSCAIAMRLCDPSVGCAQFSLFMAAANLGISVGGAMLGTLEGWGGLSAMMTGMVAVNLIAILCFSLARVGR